VIVLVSLTRYTKLNMMNLKPKIKNSFLNTERITKSGIESSPLSNVVGDAI